MTLTSIRSLVLAVSVAAIPVAVAAEQAPVDPRPPNGADQKPAFAGQTDAPERKANVAFDVVTVAEGLQNPWGMAFLPGGKMLVTERPGRLRVVTADGKLSEPVAGLPPVLARGQGGLLDVALDPAFAQERPDLLELCGGARRDNGPCSSPCPSPCPRRTRRPTPSQQHGRRPRQVRRRRDGAARGRRAGHLPSGADAGLGRPLRQPARVGA